MNIKKETLLIIILCSLSSLPGLCQFENGISGKIIDEDGIGIPGVNILLKGTTIGITTDADGKFQFNSLPSSTLIISQIGFQNSEFNLSGDIDFAANDVNLMLSTTGIRKKYWCCTSHQPNSTHCNKQRSVLRLTHHSNEVYKIKNPTN